MQSVNFIASNLVHLKLVAWNSDVNCENMYVSECEGILMEPCRIHPDVCWDSTVITLTTTSFHVLLNSWCALPCPCA
jgi:hypothetical protein